MNKEIEKETNTQNTKNQAKIGIFLQKLSVPSHAILVVTGVLALIYPIINTFYNKIYQGDCEAFYCRAYKPVSRTQSVRDINHPLCGNVIKLRVFR